VQGSDRDETSQHGPDIGAVVAGGPWIARSDPVGDLPPGVFLGDDLRVVSFLAQLGDPDSLDRRGRDVDVERDSGWQLFPEQDLRRLCDEPGRRLEVEASGTVRQEGNSRRRYAEERSLQSSANSARVRNILLSEIAAEVHSREDELGSARQELLQGDVDAISGSAVDGIDTRPDLLDPQGPAEGEG